MHKLIYAAQYCLFQYKLEFMHVIFLYQLLYRYLRNELNVADAKVEQAYLC